MIEKDTFAEIKCVKFFMFIPTYPFKAYIRKVHLLSFVATVPTDLYCFLIPHLHNTAMYGYFVSSDVVEYFLNEFLVQDFEIIPMEELEAAMAKGTYEVWGTRDIWR